MSRLVYIDPNCGKPAFYMTRMPQKYDPVRADDAEHLDGGKMIAQSPIRCGSCGRLMGQPETKNIREIGR